MLGATMQRVSASDSTASDHVSDARGRAGSSSETDSIERAACARRADRRPRRGTSIRAPRKLLDMWPQTKAAYAGDEYVVKIRGKEIRTRAHHDLAVGHARSARSRCRSTRTTARSCAGSSTENVPGSFPFTAGVFAFKRENEDPTRMFAGEGDAFRTNRRFHLLADGMPAKRLSTAFDSVTLYGNDPDLRPDIYGKVGNSGVSIATLDDMKVLYSGFDLTAPTTSVSMTINGPAPTILAMFMNTAIDQQLDKFRADNGREPTDDEAHEDPGVDAVHGARHRAGRHPQGRPGPEHLHLLHRVQPEGDGRHPGILRPARHQEFLLGVDLRLSHRRSRREPDLASSRSRCPTASRSSRRISRAACTSTTSRPTCRSSSATAWTRNTR